MTADRPVKCPFCEEYFKRSECEFKYFKNRYWHLKCFNEKDKEEEEKQKLLQYIQRLFHKKIDYKIAFYQMVFFRILDVYAFLNAIILPFSTNATTLYRSKDKQKSISFSIS